MGTRAYLFLYSSIGLLFSHYDFAHPRYRLLLRPRILQRVSLITLGFSYNRVLSISGTCSPPRGVQA